MLVKKDIGILSAVVLVFAIGMVGVIRIAPHDSASLGMVIAFATLGFNQVLQRVGALLNNQEAKQAVVDVKETAGKVADHVATVARQTNGELTDRITVAVRAAMLEAVPELKRQILAELKPPANNSAS